MAGPERRGTVLGWLCDIKNGGQAFGTAASHRTPATAAHVYPSSGRCACRVVRGAHGAPRSMGRGPYAGGVVGLVGRRPGSGPHRLASGGVLPGEPRQSSRGDHHERGVVRRLPGDAERSRGGTCGSGRTRRRGPHRSAQTSHRPDHNWFLEFSQRTYHRHIRGGGRLCGAAPRPAPPADQCGRRVVLAAIAFLVVAVAVGLVAVRWHYATDTVAGAAVSTAVVLATALTLDSVCAPRGPAAYPANGRPSGRAAGHSGLAKGARVLTDLGTASEIGGRLPAARRAPQTGPQRASSRNSRGPHRPDRRPAPA